MKKLGILKSILFLGLLSCACSSFWALLSAKFGSVFFLTNTFVVLFCFCLAFVICLIDLNNKNAYLYKSDLIMPFILGCLIVGSLIIGYMMYGVKDFSAAILNFGWIVLVLIFLPLKLDITGWKIERLFLLFSLPIMILGIAQHYLSSTIIGITSNGQTVVNAIFFLNGGSSNDVNLLSFGAQVRAFGLMDSGLTLGIFALLVLSIALYTEHYSKLFRLLLLIISIYTIYATLTRNIYIAAAFLILTKLFNTGGKSILNTRILNVLYVVITIFSFIGVYLVSILDHLTVFFASFGISTFAVRFKYINYSLEMLNDLQEKLFGIQLTPTSNWPIDNGIVAMMVDKGSLFAIFVNILFFYIYYKKINFDNNNVFRMFFLLFPIIDFGNNVTNTFGYIGVLLLFISSHTYHRTSKSEGEV